MLRAICLCTVLLLAGWHPLPASAAGKEATRAQALRGLEQPSAETRRAAVVRLGKIGTMSDADRLVARLHDTDAQIRLLATVAMWQIWGRSGDRAIDALYQRGIDQMEQARMAEAVATFSEVIRRKPSFAEAWNKRATLYYLMGEYELSLQDCAQVVQRNPNHFGALSGYGQIYLQLGDGERALGYFERALKINPNLPGASDTVLLLRQKLQQQQPRTV